MGRLAWNSVKWSVKVKAGLQYRNLMLSYAASAKYIAKRSRAEDRLRSSYTKVQRKVSGPVAFEVTTLDGRPDNRPWQERLVGPPIKHTDRHGNVTVVVSKVSDISQVKVSEIQVRNADQVIKQIDEADRLDELRELSLLDVLWRSAYQIND